MTTTLAILLSLLAFWYFVHVVTKQGVFESKAQLLAREEFVRDFPNRTVVSTRSLATLNSVDIVAVEYLDPGVVSEPNNQALYKVRSDADEATRIETQEIDQYGLMIPK